MPHQHEEIRANLRRLGRFLETIRNFDGSITDMASVFDPKYYNAAIEAVNVLAELDPDTQLYKKPSNATAIGTALKKLGLTLQSQCIKNHDDAKKKHAKDFLNLLAEDYGCSVNKGVSETMAYTRRTKKVNLPKTEDIKALDDYLDRLIKTESEKLTECFNLECWNNLAGAVMIKLQVFNRRRAGEFERLTIEDFELRESIKEDDELYQGLSEKDKISAKKYVRILIRGKLRRPVAVLMSTYLLKITQLFLEHRKSAGVPSKNQFMFGIAGNDRTPIRYLRACRLMRRFSEECGAKNDKSLRGTTLRKHIATRCVTLDLSSKQISRVANFMGHHENIHRGIYQQPVATVDILDMSKVLEKAQGQGMNVKGANESNDTTVTTENDCTDVHNATGKNFMQLLSFLSNLIDIHGLCLYSYFVTVYANTCSISDTNVLQSSVNTTGDEYLQDSSTWNSPSQQLETTTAMRALTNDRFLG